MKRKSLFNKIISLSIAAVLFLVSTGSAFAEVEPDEDFAVEAAVENMEDSAVSDVPDTEVEEEVEGTEEDTQAAEDKEEGIVIAGELEEPAEKDETTIEDPEVPEAGEKKSDEDDSEKDSSEEDKDKTEEDEEAEDEEECEHELVYTSNEDGTHIVKCSKCDMEEYTETCEYDEQGKCIHCGFERLPDPILVYEDDEVIVTVEGAVPENADLKVTPIKEGVEETKEAFDEVVSKLDEEAEKTERDVIGFLAYDICFIDTETGEEKEPDGDVKVSMSYKEAINPVDDEVMADARKIDVELMHINSETSELENLSASGDANIALNNSVAVMEATFTSDSFSKYVLTWTGRSRYLTIKFEYRDLDKNTLTPTNDVNRNLTVDDSKDPVIIAETDAAKANIPGYRYVKATTSNDKEITQWKYYKGYSSYYLELWNGNTEVKDETFSSSTKEVTIYLYYEEDISLKVSKYATGAAASDTTTEYKFQITKPDGNPLDGKLYKVGTESRTISNGQLNLKTGEEAIFYSLPAGKYKITETGNTGETYKLQDFTTEIFADESLVVNKTYDFDTTEPREYEVNVDNSGFRKVKFKNCLTTSEMVGYSQPVVQKYIRYNGDDKYDVQFKFGGPTETWVTKINEQEIHTETEPLPVDIILLVDKSYSMDTVVSGRTTRMQYVKDACTSMVAKMQTKHDVDARWMVIDFETYAYDVSNGWIRTEQVNNKVTTTTGGPTKYIPGTYRQINGGTNYDIAFKEAQKQFATAREGAKKIVIFLTDGYPTFYMNGDDLYNYKGKVTSSNYTGANYSKSIENATNESVKNLDCDYFYAVGMGLGFVKYEAPGETGGIQGFDLLSNICSNVALNVRPEDKKPVSQAYNTEPSKVGQILDSLAGTISNIPSGDIKTLDPKTKYATNATMVDTLSDYVEPQPGGVLKISVTSGLSHIVGGVSHESIINADGTVADATFDLPDGKQLTANLTGKVITLTFPENYVLDDGYEYIVRLDIQPTDKAYNEWIAHKNEDNPYPNVGDEETDHSENIPNTSSLQPGFYSNDNDASYAQYSFDGREQPPVPFPKPVIQVHVNFDWQLYKVDEEGTPLDKAEFKLVDTESNAITGTSDYQRDGIVSWENEVSAGKTYTIEETKAPLGYIADVSKWTLTLDEYNDVTFADSEGNVATYNNDNEATFTNAEGEVIVTAKKCRDGNNITYKFYYKNFNMEDKYVLPHTGGNGIYRTTLYGIVLMLISVFLFYKDRKKSKNSY